MVMAAGRVNGTARGAGRTKVRRIERRSAAMSRISPRYGRTFTEPGAHEHLNCPTCGSRMDVQRGVWGATSIVDTLIGQVRLRDVFTCPERGEEWHERLGELLAHAQGEPAGDRIDEFLAEAQEILKTRETE